MNDKIIKYDLVIDARMLGASGIGEYIEHTVKGITISSDFKILLMVFDDYLNFFGPKHSNLHYIVLKHKVYNPLENLELALKIPKSIIYWTPHFNTTILPTRAEKRLTTIHDVFHLANPSYFSFFKYRYLKFLYTMAGFLSEKIITVSKFSKDEIEVYLGENVSKKVEIVYNGFKKSSISKYKKETQDAPKILFVGNLKPHKNLGVLLDAFEALSLKRKLKLVIIGKITGFINPVSNNIIDKIKANKNIELTGYVSNEELESHYQTSSIFVFPSLYEGFGLPILEAYSNNVPTIVSNIPPFKEVASDASIYFDPSDSGDLVNKIIYLLDSEIESEKLIEKGYKRLDDFSWEKAVDEHILLIKSMILN
ncbi:glycosyltransferase family 4 protein [Algibacter sp. L1A34]|uniref:glycosyltransferase family 4 protein n=1 Tax=Algibacter sp. L1A34 TaxID=2686365 RepID=UPI00131D6382|nr:glycosyltransferase family 1 protein [Algibacter sp. L1A34]